MKKQAFVNGSVKEQVDDKFVKLLEKTTSIVDFYEYKQKILRLLRGTRK